MLEETQRHDQESFHGEAGLISLNTRAIKSLLEDEPSRKAVSQHWA